MRRSLSLIGWTCCLALVPLAAEEPAKEMEGMPLVFSDDFEAGLDHWEMTDAKAWKIEEESEEFRSDTAGAGHVLSLFAGSEYEPPVRSPHNMARVKDLNLGDFILEVDARQTGREYGHRDLCFFLDYQDPAHFYYVHLATKADEHANSVFLVNGEPRVSIAKERTEGTDWGNTYHKIRIKRTVADGRIEVYFDQMDKPVMVAEDTSFLSGTVGLGSFDDVGHFDNIRIWGTPPAQK